MTLPAAALGLSLAACSGEPSESEMLQAVTKFTSTLTVTFDYQHVENPAYNGDRGPADFLAARLHVDF